MHTWAEGEAEALDCLLSCSSSPYDSLFAGPPLNKATLSGWENVRPCAEYDLITLNRKRRKRHSSNLLTRRVVSLPNLRTKVQQKESYMSGHLDENFSYVYTRGLSDKARAEELRKEPPVYHFLDPMQQQKSRSLSTHTLTLDPVFETRHLAQMDPRTRSDVSRIIAMQLKPEILAEQLIIENRLRTLDLNAYPVLGSDGVKSGKDKIPTKSISAPSLINGASQSQQQPSHRKKRRRKLRPRPPGPLEWCSLAIQEPKHPAGVSFNDSHREGTSTQHHLTLTAHGATAASSNGLSGLLGIGSLGTAAPKHTTHEQPTKINERSSKNEPKGSWTDNGIVAYFGQQRFALENSLPVSQRDQQGPYSIPVVVPTLEQGQETRTKRFSGRLTTLHHPQSKFTANNTFTNTFS